jgi:hypothetical protein
MLCTVICAGILMLSLGGQEGVAADKHRELLPVVDGWIIDQSPFDGVGDGVVTDQFNTVFLNAGVAEARAAMEFDLSRINPHRIESASLRITSFGTGFLPGTLTIPVQVMGYPGDGAIQNDDFNAGSLVTVFDSFAIPNRVPVDIDVTEFLQGIHPSEHIVGFNLRTTVHGAEVNYGSLEMETPPTLMITLK